ncbi:hypothetical protein [Xanthomonas maliensis]|uniref:hypothetical protein n=1 Tax=Xanthomonas maliensis TaxID=1321368 RepID=UPI0014795DA6|nr:hypothetical protein [Xanthomonas maliensis]KAB7762183.1 hypothetical protein CKY51_21835 [Xanthomonas maliensis]
MTLHPDYPTLSGSYQMTDEWLVELPMEFNRRVEDGNLVLWRPGLTFWIAIWSSSGDVQSDRISKILERADPARTDQQITKDGDITRLTYELTESDPERHQSVYGSISGHVLSRLESVQISAYFDTPEARDLGYRVIHSVRNVA